MILLKISNASELVASKVGEFVERLTPDQFDDLTVEELVIKEMIENLAKQGIKGEISTVKGIDIEEKQLVLDESFKVRTQRVF